MPNTLTLGASDLVMAPLGVGTWAWGDRIFWGYGNTYQQNDIKAAFDASLAAGVSLFDTAEIYGPHTSERMLGALARSANRPVILASKFMPLPWRLSASSLRGALDGSLKRLGVSRIDLYQIHWPSPILSIPSLMEALANAVAEGKIRYVGVSNYSAAQMREAHAELSKRGVPLVSNQVEYSLLHRAPEKNGVLAACRELNVTLIAYSPLAMGLLTGKYDAGNIPSGARRYTPRFQRQNLQAFAPVAELLRQIGLSYQKNPAQVALNWLIQHGTLPIPGAKNQRQAQENAGALGWNLSSEDVAALDRATSAWI
jgi:aryl-alcohol dehydrogenase-like predicted oxidoreductase